MASCYGVGFHPNLSTPTSENRFASEKSPMQSPESDFDSPDCEMSIVSAAKTIMKASSSSPKSKGLEKMDAFPSRLLFDSEEFDSCSFTESYTQFECMETESFSDISLLRDFQGIRHLEEDPAAQLCEINMRPPHSEGLSIEECCCTPTASSNDMLSLFSQTTQLLARPSKKSNQTVYCGDSRQVDSTLEQKQSSLMGQKDFTMLLRPASLLDFQAHYQYVNFLGQGQFGEVWSVRHRRCLSHLFC